VKKNPPDRARAGLSALTAAVALALTACGGGGTSQSIVFGGVAATGAPMAQADVKVFDSSGTAVCDTTTADDGSYSCTLSAGAAAPFAVVAHLGEQSLYSTAATAASGTVNVTPLTTLIVARLAPSGDPASLVDAIKANPTVVDAQKLQAQVDEVKTLLAPLLTAVGDGANVDPISGTFAANGSGHDKVLDSLQVSIRPTGTSSNIEITVKAKPASDTSAPLQLSFKSDDAAPAPLTASIATADLVADGTSHQVDDLMQRLDACYALPLDQRIANVPAGAVSVTGTAADVTAVECKSLFVGDDPSTFKDNGATVGSTGAFAGLFKDASTGVKFDRGNFEYQWANGDMYVTFRTTSSTGVEAWSGMTVHAQAGVLKAIGNQYAYAAAVRPVAADREFPVQPQFSWFGSGYGAVIPNVIDPLTGQPLFKEANVTGPNGISWTFRPFAGYAWMTYVRPSGSQSANNNLFLAAAYQNPSTAGIPAQKDTATFLDPAFDDAALQALPDQGVWTVEWVFADTTKPDVVQTYRMLTRAPTIAEVRYMKFAQLSDQFKAELLARSDVVSSGAIVFGAPSATQPNVLSFGTASGGDGWTVPDGAPAPVEIDAFLNAAAPTGLGMPFTESTSVGVRDRKATIVCKARSPSDPHCDSSTGINQFANGVRVNFFTLGSLTSRQLSVLKQISFNHLAP
jgi:hypothetical protein